MGLKDLVITPVYMVLFTVLAVFIRPYVTNARTRKYFLPALWIRFAGAIVLGVIYQFYYSGGDTFNYWTHGSKWIYEAFQNDLFVGLKLITSGGGDRQIDETYRYASQIWYYKDSASYTIVRMAAFFDLFTFHTYSATSLFFGLFSFSGAWAMYTAVVSKYPNQSTGLAWAILFVPSVIFWGSGILKDTVTLGALGWMTWALLRWIDQGKRAPFEMGVFLLSFLLVYRVKLYILICFLPMVAVWLFFKNIKRVRSLALRVLVVPVLLLFFGVAGLVILQQITEDNKKYELDMLADRARITAYDIRYGWGARSDGDGGYDIGLPDGTWQSMVRLMPAAINVSLFRPYLWEVKNPLMLLAALESLVVFLLFMRVLIKGGWGSLFQDPFLVFCLGFSLLFAFAVGVSTFNFGTLMRYKIPMMPFFLVVMVYGNNKGINKHKDSMLK